MVVLLTVVAIVKMTLVVQEVPCGDDGGGESQNGAGTAPPRSRSKLERSMFSLIHRLRL